MFQVCLDSLLLSVSYEIGIRLLEKRPKYDPSEMAAIRVKLLKLLFRHRSVLAFLKRPASSEF